jgi:hypothetical protein
MGCIRGISSAANEAYFIDKRTGAILCAVLDPRKHVVIFPSPRGDAGQYEGALALWRKRKN